MSRLNQNTTPAERVRGCVFSETFESSQAVVQNGGAIVGTPEIDFGSVLNGTTDSISYALRGDEFNSAEISIVYEFYPDFDTDEDVSRRLFDTTSGSAYQVVKANNAGSNTLSIALGGTSIAVLAEGIYSPYWNVGARNVLVISGVSGNTSAWLNGNLILDEDNTSWSPANPANFYIGSAFSGTQRFDGRINKVQVYKSLLTAQEATDIYHNTTYSYMDNAVFHAPMDAQRHDPTNLRTLDISRGNNHMTFGDGSTPGTYPVKRQRQGYDFADPQYLSGGDLSDLNLGTAGTILATVNFDYDALRSYYVITSKEDWWALENGHSLYIDSTFGLTIQLSDVPSASVATSALTISELGGLGIFTCAATWDADDLDLYVNGGLQDNVSSPTLPTASGFPWLIGDGDPTHGTSTNWNGAIFDVVAIPLKLTPIQIIDYHIRMIQQVNNV